MHVLCRQVQLTTPARRRTTPALSKVGTTDYALLVVDIRISELKAESAGIAPPRAAVGGRRMNGCARRMRWAEHWPRVLEKDKGPNACALSPCPCW